MPERLLVHARLCRQMACASLDEALGEQLLKLADECMREATDILATERLAANSGAQIITMTASFLVSS